MYNNSKLLGKHWLDWLQAHSTREQLLELWIKKASKIAGLKIIKKMYNNAGGASGMIHLFPVQTFWEDKNNERRLLAELSKEMQDDEAVVSIYSAMGYEVHKIAFPCFGKTCNRFRYLGSCFILETQIRFLIRSYGMKCAKLEAQKRLNENSRNFST